MTERHSKFTAAFLSTFHDPDLLRKISATEIELSDDDDDYNEVNTVSAGKITSCEGVEKSGNDQGDELKINGHTTSLDKAGMDPTNHANIATVAIIGLGLGMLAYYYFKDRGFDAFSLVSRAADDSDNQAYIE